MSKRVQFIAWSFLLWMIASGQSLQAAQKAEPRRFSFVVLGHVRGNDDGVLLPLLDPLLAKVQKLKPDMIFLTGDMIWGGLAKKQQQAAVITQDWERLDAALAKLNTPVYRVAGNHDLHDPITRDIYFARYGNLPHAFTYRGSRFLLLNSSYVPEGREAPAERKLVRGRQPYLRGKQLDAAQIEFISKELAASDQYDHVYIFMHHLLWDHDEEADWWRNVHPLLTGGKVRAVFSGDVGPRKFSHLKRDGVDYIQSSIADIQMEYLRSHLRHRMIAQQFDNFLHVTVDGAESNIEVRTIGEFSSGQFTPQSWREMHRPLPQAAEPLTVRLRKDIEESLQSPRRLAAFFLLLALCFLAGVAATVIWYRRKRSDYLSR